MKRDAEEDAAAAEAAKRAKAGDGQAVDGAAGAAAAQGTAAEEEEDSAEEGEIVEGEEDALERAEKAWLLDLKRPPEARVVPSPLGFACSQGAPLKGGLWLEFGVFSGKTINLMAKSAPNKVYGFDTFEGLPEDWRDKFKKGHFHCKGKLPKVADNVELVQGLFQDTLVPFLEAHSAPADMKVAVAHLDADLYSATIYVLRELGARIVPGTLLVFDELINYDGFEEHEWKALKEAVAEFGWEFEWIAQSAALEDPVKAEIAEMQQVALRITKVGGATAVDGGEGS